MWRLKHFLPKDQASLEGKSVEVGPLKLQVRSTIAQGGFSSVYLARDAQSGKTYALKHIICNDQELLDLVKKEVSIMKMLKGHPNVVTLHAQAVFDMGRTKECFLVMENCDKTLVNVLDNRGAGYFDEKQLLLMFRDICNAVYAMHCQSPPVAHRDLKAENVLLGPDGLWKLCDFGSTSTNHKCFERADEMGVEEDNIRKHTTPAYRAPEMWDLYQREVLSEKVDIWALGCLLFRMAYLKFAFDGESKLQILNGNYRIPDAPRYSSSVTNLIKDMLSTSPGTRPDILQVWHRVNESLPNDCRKACPDKPPTTAIQQSETTDSRITGPTKTSPVAPSRSPPPPPPSGSKETERRPVQTSNTSGSIGSFWSTQYAQEVADNSTKRNGASSPSKARPKSPVKLSPNSSKEHASAPSGLMKKSGMGSLVKKVQGSVGQKGKDDNLEDGYKIMTETGNEHGSASKSYPSTTTASSISELKGQTVYSSNTASPVSEVKGPSTDGAFNAFVAEFDGMVHGSGSGTLRTNEQLMADIDRLNAELKQVVVEKVEISGKYEKLTAICRSQRQEIQDLKSALAAASSQANTKDAAARSVRTTPSNSRDKAENWQNFDQTIEKRNGTIWDLQDNSSPNQSRAASEQRDPRSWQAFNEFSGRPLQQPNDNQAGLKGSPVGDHADARRRQHTRAASISGNDTWNFVQDSFAAANNTFHDPKATDYKSSARLTAGLNGGLGSTSFRATGSPKEIDPRKSVKRSQQPAGWAGF